MTELAADTTKAEQKAKDTPGPRQAEGGAQLPPGVSATKTSPTKAAEDKGGAGVGGAQEAKHEGEEPKNVVTDTKSEPAKAAGNQLTAAPTVTKLQKNSRYKLTKEKAESLSRAELRAVASDRGYKLPIGGRMISVGAFLAEQEKDDSLVDPPKEGEEAKEAKKK